MITSYSTNIQYTVVNENVVPRIQIAAIHDNRAYVDDIVDINNLYSIFYNALLPSEEVTDNIVARIEIEIEYYAFRYSNNNWTGKCIVNIIPINMPNASTVRMSTVRHYASRMFMDEYRNTLDSIITLEYIDNIASMLATCGYRDLIETRVHSELCYDNTEPLESDYYGLLENLMLEYIVSEMNPVYIETRSTIVDIYDYSTESRMHTTGIVYYKNIEEVAINAPGQMSMTMTVILRRTK